MFLKHLRSACCHAGVHGGCAEGIDADAFTGFRESVLSQGHQDANTNLHGVTAEGFKKKAIDGFRIFGCEIRHLEHDLRVLVHGPETLGTIHPLPSIFGSSVQTFFPKEMITELTGTPVRPQAGEKGIPCSFVATAKSDAPLDKQERNACNRHDLEKRENHFDPLGAG